MPLLEYRDYYKPFEYPWAFEAYNQQKNMFWTPEEVSLSGDVSDWARLSYEEQNLLKQIFRFFTTVEVDVASGYIDKFMPIFKPPEIRMMLSMFTAMEAIHQHAYSLLLDTVGMPEAEFQSFLEYKEMLEKHEWNKSTSMKSLSDIAETLAIYSAFTEGVQLFSSFAILLNFPRNNKMKGMEQIVTWALKDEDNHVEGMTKLFRTFIEEHPRIWGDELKGRIYQAARDAVYLEDQFIDRAFEAGGIEGLESGEVKTYIRYIADRRLLALGLKQNWYVENNPLLWMEWMVHGIEHANFFERRSTEYAKGSLAGDWSEVWNV